MAGTDDCETARRSLSQVRAGQLLTAASRVQSTASASRLGRNRTQQRLGQAPGSGGQSRSLTGWQRDGLAIPHQPNAARPATPGASRAAMAAVPPGLPPQAQIGVGGRRHGTRWRHHKATVTPQPASSNTLARGGSSPVPAIHQSGVRCWDQGWAINRADSRQDCSVSARSVAASAGSCTRMDRYFDRVLNTVLLEWRCIEAPQLRLHPGQPDPCGRNVRCKFEASAARRTRPARSREEMVGWAIMPRILQNGSRWARRLMLEGALRSQQPSPAPMASRRKDRVPPSPSPSPAEPFPGRATQGLPVAPRRGQPRSVPGPCRARACCGWLHRPRCCDSATPAPEVPT